MSGGDFKVLLRLADGRTCYVDVFVAFYSDGVFYQLGNRSGGLPRSAVTPTSTIVLEGVELPAPADPEAMLAFVYGPGWRVPDPSFRFADPPGACAGSTAGCAATGTSFRPGTSFSAAPTLPSLPRRSSDLRPLGGPPVLLGTSSSSSGRAPAGTPPSSRDAATGSGPTTSRRTPAGPPSAGCAGATRTAEVRRLMLGELRTVVLTGAEIGVLDGRRHLYARGLVGCLGAEARRNLWRLARMALSGDRGCLFLEFAATRPTCPTPF